MRTLRISCCSIAVGLRIKKSARWVSSMIGASAAASWRKLVFPCSSLEVSDPKMLPKLYVRSAQPAWIRRQRQTNSVRIIKILTEYVCSTKQPTRRCDRLLVGGHRENIDQAIVLENLSGFANSDERGKLADLLFWRAPVRQIEQRLCIAA